MGVFIFCYLQNFGAHKIEAKLEQQEWKSFQQQDLVFLPEITSLKIYLVAKSLWCLMKEQGGLKIHTSRM